MTLVRRNSWAVIVSAGLLLCLRGPAGAQTQQADDHSHMAMDESGGVAGELADVQIARAIAAGPPHVTGAARIVGADGLGRRIVLREGGNGFTCQPGNPRVPGRPASCSNAAALQWMADMAAHQPKPTNAEPGIVYMLAGATPHGASDPTGDTGASSTTTPAAIGPHWMILWPFDPKATGLSATPKDAGAFIMAAGTPYAHLHIMGSPVGAPMEHLADHMQDEGGPVTVEPQDVQMARAIAAGPAEITGSAQIMGFDPEGKRIVLREGSNGFICQPGMPQFVAQPATCYTTESKPRIVYMLAGATQRSITDPDDKKSPPLAVGPHWMIMMPFDPKTTGLPVTYSDTGTYVMWAGTRSAHLHIMGRP
jgi:hypothetical protein